MKFITINQFDGGMVNDGRDPRANVCRTCQHFDAFSNPRKLTPYRSFETGDGSASTNKITAYATDGTTLYGLGNSGGGAPEIFSRTAFADASWTSLKNIGNT